MEPLNSPYRDPLIGQVIRDYVVERKIAEGGMGALYLARHQDPRSAAKVAIKILLPAFATNEAIRERFDREALLVQSLNHPYIVRIQTFGDLPDGQRFLMMDYLDGKDLEHHIVTNRTFTVQHTLHVLAQVMSALQALHEKGIVHRDLKPSNIFLLNTKLTDYSVKLIDLGIARDLKATDAKVKTLAGAMGTPGYMAFEQYESPGTATPAADVYGVAVIAWRMLFGELPWGDVTSEGALYFAQKEARFDPPKGFDVPSEIVQLLRSSLSPEPTDRPTVHDFVAIFASHTFANGPHVRSGAAILDRVAPEFLRGVSDTGETVRDSSKSEFASGAYYPPRGTRLPAPGSRPLPSSQPQSASGPSPTPMLAATANERPAARPNAPAATTISGSSGMVAVPTPASASVPRPPRTKSARALMLVGAGVAVAIASTVVVAALTHARGVSPAAQGSAASEPAQQPVTISPQVPATPPAATDTHPSSSSATAENTPPAGSAVAQVGSAVEPAQVAPTLRTVARPHDSTTKRAEPTAINGRQTPHVAEDHRGTPVHESGPTTSTANAPTQKGQGSAGPQSQPPHATAPRSDQPIDPNAIVE